MLYPLTFRPLLKERLWGGRRLESLFRKPLAPDLAIGESWEISDRPGDVSVVDNGALAGRDLRWVVENHGKELYGDTVPNGRFPLLVKLLDAQQTLSLQVHPPQAKATELGGEPKTEMWYVAQAEPDSELFVGLKAGITRSEFESRLQQGTVAECFHRIRVRAGDCMFLPSGRVHALGSGLVIFEIQQNSDTTYRVFDWNRLGPDGRPRALHIPESLASIDFIDFEPGLAFRSQNQPGPGIFPLVNDPLFRVDLHRPSEATNELLGEGRFQILGVTAGELGLPEHGLKLSAGQFCLVPASIRNLALQTASGSAFIRVRQGS